MRRGLSSRLVCCFLLLGLFVSLPAFSQKITGDISGTVSDPSWRSLANGAIVTAVNQGNGEKATATTNDTGFYRLVNSSPGQYKVTVSVFGFKSIRSGRQR